jgi:hypothetical protein
VYWPKKGLSLISWEEGVESLEGRYMEKYKSIIINLPYSHPKRS